MTVSGTQNAKICAPCGGRCCKRMPGIAWPADFGKNRAEIRENLTNAIASKTWAFDCWEGGEGEWWPRPATKPLRDRNGEIVCPPHWPLDRSWGGECVFLSHIGCALTFEKRPTECRDLKPKADNACFIPKGSVSEGGKRAAVAAWKPYRNIIRGIIKQMEAST